MAEADPQTGAKWVDRYGLAYGRGFRRSGNVEPYLAYRKLHRTGRLLRGLKVRRTGNRIILYNNVPYASDHELGGYGQHKTIRKPYVSGGVTGVLVGGDIHARPFMRPSKKVLDAAYRLVSHKMKSFGW